jgi:hypothetical protein
MYKLTRLTLIFTDKTIDTVSKIDVACLISDTQILKATHTMPHKFI